jgi:hypothetical protein
VFSEARNRRPDESGRVSGISLQDLIAASGLDAVTPVFFFEDSGGIECPEFVSPSAGIALVRTEPSPWMPAVGTPAFLDSLRVLGIGMTQFPVPAAGCR